MAVKKTAVREVTEIRLRVPHDLKKAIADFRAKRTLKDEPLTSDEKAILHLVGRALHIEI